MRLSRLFVMSIVFGSALAACGDDDGGGGGGSVDAAPIIDASPDAPSALTGLGQACGQGGTQCPANAPVCLVKAQNGPGFCSPVCVEDGTGTTNAMAQFGQGSITPAPDDAVCAAAFTGNVGTPACGLLIELTPEDNPLMANKTYTGIVMTCAIICGQGNTCPAGLTCQQGICDV